MVATLRLVPKTFLDVAYEFCLMCSDGKVSSRFDDGEPLFWRPNQVKVGFGSGGWRIEIASTLDYAIGNRKHQGAGLQIRMREAADERRSGECSSRAIRLDLLVGRALFLQLRR